MLKNYQNYIFYIFFRCCINVYIANIIILNIIILTYLCYFSLRWDINTGSISESSLKELHTLMPVIYCKALTQDKQDTRSLYSCPIYKTRERGPTYVWTFNLRTKTRASRWILAGVALIMQV